MLKVLCQAVVTPHTVAETTEAIEKITEYGWLFTVVRWLSYSVIFSFRDYHGAWKPFFPPPFGLNVDTYAVLQKYFSLGFGLVLMGLISVGLSSYLQSVKKEKCLSTAKIFNILGVTFFIPWVIVQIIDFLVVITVGWVYTVIIPLHVSVLIWESYAASEIISRLCNLKRSEKVLSTTVIIVVWIVLCAALWR